MQYVRGMCVWGGGGTSTCMYKLMFISFQLIAHIATVSAVGMVHTYNTLHTSHFQ